MSWETLKNGQLLAAAASAGFDAIITVDKNFRHQQVLDSLPFTVVELNTPDTRLSALVAMRPALECALQHTAGFRFISVHVDGRIETLAARP